MYAEHNTFNSEKIVVFLCAYNINIFKMAQLPPVKPFPDLPDPAEYQHLSELDKMNRGYPYRPLDSTLTKMRTQCRELIQQYNRTSFDDETTRRQILDKLLHPSCKDKTIFIEPSFRCDYGPNITVGNNFYANFDCCLLDSGLIEIGDDCMLAPGVHMYAATHPVNAAYRLLDDPKNYFELTGSIKIGNCCWFGGGSIINPGVSSLQRHSFKYLLMDKRYLTFEAFWSNVLNLICEGHIRK